MTVHWREGIVAQARPRRKGWRAVVRVAGLVLIAAIVAFPASFISGMLMTPLLWRLEPVLKMELAGHSGPSDWILETLFAVMTIALAAILLWVTRPTRDSSADMSPSSSTRTDTG